MDAASGPGARSTAAVWFADVLGFRGVPTAELCGHGIESRAGADVDACRGHLGDGNGHGRVVGPFAGREGTETTTDHVDARRGSRIGEFVSGAEGVACRGGEQDAGGAVVPDCGELHEPSP